MSKHGKRKQTYLIRIDQTTKNKLDTLRFKCHWVNKLSYNDIILSLLEEYSKKQEI